MGLTHKMNFIIHFTLFPMNAISMTLLSQYLLKSYQENMRVTEEMQNGQKKW